VRQLLAVTIAALVVPGAAFAHATLTGTSPPTQSRVDAAPTAIVLRFDQTVTATSTAIDVFSAGGRRVSGPTTRARDGRVLSAPLRGLRRGEAYTVRWRATSSAGKGRGWVRRSGGRPWTSARAST